MKVSNKTKNVRQRFFRAVRRRLLNKMPVEVGEVRARPEEPASTEVIDRLVAYPAVYTPPASRKQGVKGRQQ